MELIFKQINLKDRDIKYSCLDEFMEYYGWCAYSNGRYYILEDTQTGETVDFYVSFDPLLDRISSRALDYELNECEHDYQMSKASYHYFTDILSVYLISHIDDDDLSNTYKEKWFKDIIKELKEMEVVENER